MKVLISILIGLLVVGCGKGNQTANTNEGNNTPAKSSKKEAGKSTPSKGDDKNSNKTKPSKEITKEDELNILDGLTSTATRLVYDTVAATPESVVGTFVIDEDSVWAGGAYKKFILQDNGVIRLYPGVRGVASDGDEQKWHINDAGEVSVKDYSDLKFKATSNGRLILFGKFGEIEYKRVKDTKPTSETKEPAEGEKKFIETKAKAEAGDAEAQYFLGAMYVDDGIGVLEDHVTAYAWWNIAAANGNEEAKKLKVDFATVLTPAQITKAGELVKEMVKKNPKLLK